MLVILSSAATRAPATAQNVTLAIEDVVVTAGSTATITVGISGIPTNGGPVSNAQLDVLAPTAVLEIPDDLRPVCMSPRFPFSLGFLPTASLPATPPAPEGTRRVRLSVVDSSQPASGLTDGVFFQCIFPVRRDVTAGTYAVAATRLNVGDDQGTVLPSTSEDGTVTVVDCPLCAGDCDHDCDVLGNEITVAIQIVAGNQNVESCAAADVDGDHTVLGNEVTQAIGRLAGGCDACCIPAAQ